MLQIAAKKAELVCTPFEASIIATATRLIVRCRKNFSRSMTSSTARRRSKPVPTAHSAFRGEEPGQSVVREVASCSWSLCSSPPSRAKIVASIYALCVVYSIRNSTHLPLHFPDFSFRQTMKFRPRISRVNSTSVIPRSRKQAAHTPALRTCGSFWPPMFTYT